MDITTLAAWGEFLGGIAVVVSLIYLAGQIRQNSKLMRASTAAVTLEGLNATSSMVAEDPEVGRIWWAGLDDRSALSKPDAQRFDTLISMQVSHWDQEFDFVRDGLMSDRLWQRRRRQMTWQLQQPGMQQHWRDWEFAYGDEFRAFVDGLIREGEAAG